MKFINTLSSMLLATFLLENAYAGIDQETHVEVNIYNQTQDLSLRCYGEPIRQGDVGNMYDNMDYVNIGNNDIDRGRLIADSSPAHHYNIDAETIYADFVDYANTYNVSWAVCYVYPSVHLSCMDTNYQSVPVDITDKTSANAYAYSTGYIGGPDPWIFFAPATDYDDMPQVERYDSPIAVIEIGMTPMSDVFYNTTPLYNVGSPYASVNEDGSASYHYDNMGKFDSCEAEGYQTDSTKAISFDASRLQFSIVYQPIATGSYNDKFSLTLTDNSGV
ncbi:hypothetical protein [Fangia hongkongensis]|uniref:hypothetical protein n=1 Tax=Fangia hongkongensis TaxID=270495 RepID=UPI000382BD88|nr:hypothetical protein [Fangia hongkongensis]MBK2124186.1 hypothetical protein [Fangia hongkongensis]